MNRQKGFSIVEIVIIIAILVVLALVGWRLWQQMSQSNDQTATPTSQTSGQVQTPPIDNENDLNRAAQRLDSVDVDGNYQDELDQQTSF